MSSSRYSMAESLRLLAATLDEHPEALEHASFRRALETILVPMSHTSRIRFEDLAASLTAVEPDESHRTHADPIWSFRLARFGAITLELYTDRHDPIFPAADIIGIG